jgi:uncharacterized membrane protein
MILIIVLIGYVLIAGILYIAMRWSDKKDYVNWYTIQDRINNLVLSILWPLSCIAFLLARFIESIRWLAERLFDVFSSRTRNDNASW